jgi:hypothetical protein
MKILSHIRSKAKTSPSSCLSWILLNVSVTALYFIVSSTVAYAGQVILGWDKSTEPDVAGYKIYYGTATRNYTQNIKITSPDITTVTIINLLDGQKYYFAATAYNSGLIESDYSEEVSCTIASATTSIPTTTTTVQPTTSSSTTSLRPTTTTTVQPTTSSSTTSLRPTTTTTVQPTTSSSTTSLRPTTTTTVQPTTSSSIPVPGCAGIAPASAEQGATLYVTITGKDTSFTDGVGGTEATFCDGITVNSITVTSATVATANITIAPDATVGVCNVTVTTGTEIVTCTAAFTITAAPVTTTTSTVKPTTTTSTSGGNGGGGGGGGGGSATPLNTTPIADAGADQEAFDGDLITLDGSGSYDNDGDTLTYQWAQISGPTVALSNATDPQLEFNAPAAGTFTFSLVVSDGQASSVLDTVTIIVKTADNRPVAMAGNDSTLQIGDKVVLNGAASYDSDGDTLSYKWIQVSGPAVNLSNPDSATPDFIAAIEGNYQFDLTVFDGILWSVTDSVVITIKQPTINLISPGSDVKMSGSVKLMWYGVGFVKYKVLVSKDGKSFTSLGETTKQSYTLSALTTLTISSRKSSPIYWKIQGLRSVQNNYWVASEIRKFYADRTLKIYQNAIRELLAMIFNKQYEAPSYSQTVINKKELLPQYMVRSLIESP